MPAIPLRGDRSAWDAESYKDLHTNGIDASASSIHHTLGTGQYQAASGSHVHLLTSLSSGSAQEGYVLTASGSGIASWQPADSWRVSLMEDTNINSSDKKLTIPVNKEWQLLWVWVEYTSSSVAGNRQMELQFQSSASNIISQVQAGIIQPENLTYKYMFGIAVADMTALRDGNNLTTPLSGGTFLSGGQKVRIWDNKAIDASADDMTIRIQYAQRSI